jgi:pyridoxamine 5'-phosphate oxidase-like protein
MKAESCPMDEEIRKKILTLLDQHRIMTIATLRPDGLPQATLISVLDYSKGLGHTDLVTC